MIGVLVDCPTCGRLHTAADIERGAAIACACGTKLTAAPAAIAQGRLLRCPLCATEEMYVQKDFPERIGMAIVAAGVVLASIAWANYSWVGTFGILFGFGLADWLFFYTRKNVTVCYRCLARYRGMAANPSHAPFDLAIGEKFRQERLRRAELRNTRYP